MSRNLRDERDKLMTKNKYLKSLAKEDKLSYRKKLEIYEIQNEMYRKYKFYDNFIKAKEKENGKIK